MTSHNTSPESDTTMSTPYGDMGLDDFLRALAAREPAPGGGAVAGVAIAMSAGLVAMAARFSESTLDASHAVAQRAEQLQRRAMTLADEDACAYRSVLEAYALPRDDDAETRRAAVRTALRRAADVPLQIAAAGNDVAAMAVRLVAQGNRNLEGDAYAAVCIASAAVRSAAALVRLNVNAGQLETELADRAAELVSAAENASNRADEISSRG